MWVISCQAGLLSARTYFPCSMELATRTLTEVLTSCFLGNPQHKLKLCNKIKFIVTHFLPTGIATLGENNSAVLYRNFTTPTKHNSTGGCKALAVYFIELRSMKFELLVHLQS